MVKPFLLPFHSVLYLFLSYVSYIILKIDYDNKRPISNKSVYKVYIEIKFWVKFTEVYTSFTQDEVLH